jgi:hypothetical protein
MSNFSITLEPFGGSTILSCAEEAINLANKLQVTVIFDFNDVHCMACPDDDAKGLATSYFEQLKKEHGYKMARDKK